MRGAAAVLAVALGLLAGAPAPAAAQRAHLLVVVGLGGTDEHREAFHGWAVALRDAAVEAYGVRADDARILSERPEMDALRIAGRSTRENVASALEELAARAGPEDRVMVVLIGHGTSRDGESRFNLPGPDLSAADFERLLVPLGDRPLAFVNTASASGPFVEALAGPGRTVVAATRTALERNETTFPRYFVAAFVDEAADLDKDRRVSLLEAFRYARREVERHYEEEGLLLTEHAVLDDSGDGVGSEEPGPDAEDGALAGRFHLGAPAAATAEAGAVPETDDPALRALYRERADLQARVEALRARRGRMEPEAYERELEALLLELALKAREIREREGGSR